MSISPFHPDFLLIAFNDYQAEIGEWADKTFPKSDSRSKINHLRKEVEELFNAGPAERGAELADCMLLLLHYAHANKISALHEIRKKFAVIKKRTWGKPDPVTGIVEHIREAGEDRS